MALASAVPNLFSPVLIFLLETLITGSVLAFTPPRSIYRLAALSLVAACAYTIVVTSHECMRADWASLLAGTSIGFLLQYIELSLLSKWGFERGGAVSQNSRGNDKRFDALASDSTNGALKRLRAGLSRTFSFRNVNTPAEVKNVPQFSARQGYVPSRGAFLLRTAMISSICYLFLDLSSSQPPPKNNAELFSWEKVPLLTRLGDATVQQLTLRLISTLSYWVTMYCIMEGVTTTVAVLAVGLNLSEPQSWRPLFGSPAEAYTLRRFWSVFWHQTLRQILTRPAFFLTHNVVRFPKGLILRYMDIFLAFFISGLLHTLAEFGGGLPLQQSGTLRFFSTQVLGIMIEDGVEAAYRSAHTTRMATRPSLWFRLLGYIWVIAFLVWSTPAWLYPQAAGEIREKFLPYSIVRKISNKRSRT